MAHVQPYEHCRGSMQTAVCRRPARYIVNHATQYQLRAVPNTQAMFCYQHGTIYARRMMTLLAEAKAWREAEQHADAQREE